MIIDLYQKKIKNIVISFYIKYYFKNMIQLNIILIYI